MGTTSKQEAPIYRVLCAVIAVIGVAAALGQALQAGTGTTAITFQSSTYADFRQLLAGEAPTATVTVEGKLRFPDEARVLYPAVIVVHTISGYRKANEGYAAAELRKAGFATLTYDSFTARGTTGVSLAGSPAYLPAGVADAYAALRRLAREPRIDPDRIAVLGFSFGGELAHLTAFERLRSALAPQARFAAHVAFYPGGNLGVIADRGAYTGSPVLMLLGEKDDNLPLAKIEGYLAYARAVGHPAPIETVIYRGAYHAWTVPSVTGVRFYPEYLSTKKCPLILLGARAPMFLVDGQTKPFDPAFFTACMSEAPGYSMAFDAAAREQSIGDAVQFLRRKLQP